MNKFTTKSDSSLATIAGNASLILQSNPSYHVPSVTSGALGAAASNLSSLIDSAKSAQDAAKAATTDKLRGRETTIAALNAVAAIVYVNGTTDSALQAIGFSPRAGGSRPVAPVTATGLAASVQSDGAIRLDWKRAGNRASAIFQVERSLDGGATWGIVASTTQVKATLSGYAPGVPVWLRVTTTNSVGTSLPSGVVGVYVGEAGADAAVELKLAA